MRKLWLAGFLVAALVSPTLAHAGFLISSSVGTGYTVAPKLNREQSPYNLLVAPGYGLGEMLRAEVGLVFDMPKSNEDGTTSDLNLRLRPMLVIDPPILPLYARVVFGVTNLFSGERSVEYGGALGVGGSLFGLGVYAEAGVIPQMVKNAVDETRETAWIVEGRAGLYYHFD